MLSTIDLALIDNGQRLRDISEAHVASLINSISDVGLLNPITVYPRQLYRGGILVSGFGLIAGLHRKTACERLGMTEIEAHVLDLPDLERQIAECDENLCGPQLSASDRARFTRRRKEAYEALHPETRHGGGRTEASRQLDDLKTAERFTADTASATGQSERTIQRDAERGAKIDDAALDLVRGTKLDTGLYLDALKTVPPEEQVATVRHDLSLKREPEQVDHKSAQRQKFWDMWAKLDDDVREELHAKLRSM